MYLILMSWLDFIAFIDGVQPTQQNTEFVIRELFPIQRTLFGDMWTFSGNVTEVGGCLRLNF